MLERIWRCNIIRISIGAGVIDQDFRGNLSVLLYNHSENPYDIRRGDKIVKTNL
jgi:dUTP pyrophosphatase